MQCMHACMPAHANALHASRKEMQACKTRQACKKHSWVFDCSLCLFLLPFLFSSGCSFTFNRFIHRRRFLLPLKVANWKVVRQTITKGFPMAHQCDGPLRRLHLSIHLVRVGRLGCFSFALSKLFADLEQVETLVFWMLRVLTGRAEWNIWFFLDSINPNDHWGTPQSVA